MSIATNLTGTWAGESTPEGIEADEAATAADPGDPSGEAGAETVGLASEDLGGRVQLDLPAIDLGGWTWEAPNMGITLFTGVPDLAPVESGSTAVGTDTGDAPVADSADSADSAGSTEVIAQAQRQAGPADACARAIDIAIAVPDDEFAIQPVYEGDDALLVAGPDEDVFDFGKADDSPSDPVEAGDSGQVDDPLVPGDIDFTVTLMPFDPVICILIVDPILEELPVAVICPAPIEEPGQLYYGEAICGLTDAAIPAALAI